MVFAATEDIVTAVKERVGCMVTVIGRFSSIGATKEEQSGMVFLVNEDGENLEWKMRGWEHF